MLSYSRARRTLVFRLCIAVILLFSCSLVSCAGAGSDKKKVCIKSYCVLAEVAGNDADRQRGLMFRESLAENEGMLFVFDREDKYGFWMKNMKIPLDIIWMDSEKRIVDIKKEVPACSIEPCPTLIPGSKAQYVLEVQSGLTDRKEIKVGDQAAF